MSNDPLDERLRALGAGTPFSMDWADYESRLFARLARTRARRAWRMGLAALVGAVAGVAATLAFAPLWIEKTAERSQPKTASLPAKDAVNAAEGHEAGERIVMRRNASGVTMVIISGRENELPDPAPFSRTRTENGRVGTIRFDGFSATGSGSSSGFIVVKKSR